MSASLTSIANALGLSKSTISWILSGRGESKGFNASTIKMVKEYADKIGYRPNLLARSLSTGATNTIALIIPAIDDTFYSQMTQAVERESQKHGYTLIVCSSEGEDNKERKLITTLCSRQVDGLIIAPAKRSKDGIEALLRESFPFVLIDRYFPEIRTNYVIVNNEESSYDLVRCMTSLGANKIALLTTDTHLLVMNRRIGGYLRAVADSGAVIDGALCVEVDRADYKNDITGKLDRLFESHPDVDGFFFSTHYLALEAIRYFISKGIDYHSRFELGCFHTTIALDVLAPQMHISMMPIERMGIEAVDMLIRNIRSKKTHIPEELMLANELI